MKGINRSSSRCKPNHQLEGIRLSTVLSMFIMMDLYVSLVRGLDGADRQDWLEQLISVFEQAEDLESLEDIHAVSNIVHLLRTS
jgi:hypothetical protein